MNSRTPILSRGEGIPLWGLWGRFPSAYRGNMNPSAGQKPESGLLLGPRIHANEHELRHALPDSCSFALIRGSSAPSATISAKSAADAHLISRNSRRGFLILAEFQFGDGGGVNLIRAIGQPQRANVGPGRGQERVLGDASAAVSLNGAIENA